jgi:hypothetical protein
VAKDETMVHHATSRQTELVHAAFLTCLVFVPKQEMIVTNFEGNVFVFNILKMKIMTIWFLEKLYGICLYLRGNEIMRCIIQIPALDHLNQGQIVYVCVQPVL